MTELCPSEAILRVQFLNAQAPLITAAHAKQIPVLVWTVPPGPQVDRLKALKVNFIITDHPRDVKAQLAGYVRSNAAGEGRFRPLSPEPPFMFDW